MQECRSFPCIRVKKPFKPNRQTPIGMAERAKYETQKLNKGLPRIAQITGDAGMSRKCHGKARIVAHFRLTPRSKVDHRSNTTGKHEGMGFRMTSIAAELAKKTGQKTTARKNPGEMLDQRYRQIGIAAVAAAARYNGTTKNPASAPVSADWYDRAGDAA